MGPHTITVTATDNAGNVAKAEMPLFVARPTTPVAAGPGSLNRQSGELSLGATDVSVSGPGGGLSVSRSYGSLHATPETESEPGPLGPGWSMSLAGEQNITKLPNGNVLLTAGTGLQAVFVSKGSGEFTPPKGDEGLKLKEIENKEKAKEFTLTAGDGGATQFTLVSGGTGSTWVPTTREGANKTGVTTFAYQTAKGVTEPTEEIAPVAAGVKSCSPTLERGCRALGFVYDSKTTAKGEGASEWGEYEGRLKEVTVTAWEPSAGKMQTTAVAEYEYDKQGRLRAEWNPGISPALKTTYGYDAAGHITALTPAGQQPWLMTYGMIAGDTRTGRLLAITRPAASTAAGDGVAPVNTTAPALSTTSPVEGSTVSVSNGSWSNSPLSYAYQWEECDTETKTEECWPILGATNQTYTPTNKTYPLEVQVTATDSDGSVTVTSDKSGKVAMTNFFEDKVKFGTSGSGKLSKPTVAAVDSSENVWVTDTGNHRVVEFSSTGTFIAAYGWGVTNGKEEFQACTGSSCLAGLSGSKEGEFKEPTGITIGKNGYIYVADSGNTRIEVLSSAGKYVTEKTTSAAPAGIAVGKTVVKGGGEYEELYATEPSKDAVQAFEVEKTGALRSEFSFGAEGTGEVQFKDPTAVTTGDVLGEYGNYIYVSDTGNNRVEVLQPLRLTELGLSDVLYSKQTFGKEGKGEGQFSSPGSLAFEPEGLKGQYDSALAGRLFVTDTGNNRVQEFAYNGYYEHQYALGSGAQGIAFNTDTGASAGDMYLASSSENAVVEWASGGPPNPLPEPPNPGASALTTIEYHVPVSGTGAPYAMGSKEVEAWAQKDDPSEATAIFPPDEPEGWPAQNYKRASVYYLDSTGRTVNTAVPSGGVSTTEYNSTDDVSRTLSPDNRAAALKEGSKSAEKASLLGTESTYNSEGTELLETLGPLHTVKLANGTQLEARAHTVYHYDEGAPSEGGPYDLVTKVTSGALTTGKEEFDVRTTSTSYSGQANLGWKLRKPTSVTTDPGGLNLVQTIEYNTSTGDVAETKMPAASGKDEKVPPTYASQFGSYGTEKETGKFKEPRATAIAGTGSVYVMDTGNSRVEEFSASGGYLNTFGKEGSGNGEFKNPYGIVEDSKGDLWVADTGNNRVQEFNSKNEYHTQFGKEGTGVGQLKEPKGVAVTTGGYVFVVDAGNNRIDKFKEDGEFVLGFGFGVVNGKEEPEICTTSCQAGLTGSGNGEFNGPRGVAVSASGDVLVADAFNDRIQEFNEKGEYITKFGSAGKGNGQFEEPKAITTDSVGHVWVTDTANDRIQEFSLSGAYMDTFGAKGTGNGQFEEPWGTAITSAGDIYVADIKNNRVEEWTPTVTGNEGAHDIRTIYYSAKEEAEASTCRNHPEWANLPCETMSEAQPGTSGLPELPTTTYTYNLWDEPEITTQTVGSTTRTTTNTYDSAGRLKSTAISSTVGTALPTVTDEYNKETGALEKQSTITESKTKTVTNTINKLGQLTSYADADENTATYTYDIDGRLEKSNDGKGTQTYTYNTTTGLLTQLVDSAAGTFTAGYDVEGNMLTEGYPNGMTATYTLNQVGEATGLEYKKITNCTEEEKEKCKWFKDTVVPSIHGQWLSQTSTLSSQAYTYDAGGRLTQVQNTPAGKGCTTHIYAYDEDTNRTSLTSGEPNSKGECSTETSTVEGHTYDTADRLTDTGTSYNTFGDITSLPAADAGGSELTSIYYVDNQLASQTQNGETIGDNLDPSGRTREIVSTGKTNQDIINHYAAGGDSPVWTIETPSGNWTRNIKGISGGLAAIRSTARRPSCSSPICTVISSPQRPSAKPKLNYSR